MQRVNLKQYYEFGYVVHALTVTPAENGRGIEYLVKLFNAKQGLEAFVKDQMIPMPISKAPAEELLHKNQKDHGRSWSGLGASTIGWRGMAGDERRRHI